MHIQELTNEELSEASGDLDCLMRGISPDQRPLLLALVDALEMVARELLCRAVGPGAAAQVWQKSQAIIRGNAH